RRLHARGGKTRRRRARRRGERRRRARRRRARRRRFIPMSWLSIIFTFALVDNVILSRLLGISPATSAPGGMRAAASVGGFMAVLMAACGVGGWVLDSQVLVPLGFTLLRTPV